MKTRVWIWHCRRCGSIQVSRVHWLAEAYGDLGRIHRVAHKADSSARPLVTYFVGQVVDVECAYETGQTSSVSQKRLD